MQNFRVWFESLNFIWRYLTNQKQKISINHAYSSYSDGVSQGFVLNPFLFNTGICDVFLLNSSLDIASFTDDSTLYISGPTNYLVKTKLEMFCKNFFKFWNEHIYNSKSKSSISCSQLAEVLRPKYMESRARICKILYFIKQNLKNWLGLGSWNNVSVDSVKLTMLE